MAKSTAGNKGAFTYDFGIMISQATVGKLERVARNTLTLAGAYYALNRQATEYVSTLRKQQMFFGGQVRTMKAIADAQERIIQGTARFDMTDQLEGMNNLMRVGIDARKEFEWTEKAAHAMGVSYTQFSNAIANGIRGNMSGLVEMGLITERATRMFEKYQGNTIMRQQAILNFVKQHKGLQAAIANDFGTIKDEVRRLTTVWKNFLQAVLGQPNDPGSFYSQIRSSIKGVADAFARNSETICRYGFQIGQVLGWIVRQVGHVVTWLGRQVKQALSVIWSVGEDYKERVRSFVVWLEFEKLYILDFLREHKKAIMWVVKAFLVYKVAKLALHIGTWIINSIINAGTTLVAFGKTVWSVAKGIGRAALWLVHGLLTVARHTVGFFIGLGKTVWGVLKIVSLYLGKGLAIMWRSLVSFGRLLIGGFRALYAAIFGSNPIGWIIIGLTALIVLVVKLYKHCEPFRNFVDNLWVKIKGFFKDVWEGIKGIGRWFASTWSGIKNTAKGFGGWCTDNVWTPLKNGITSVGNFFAQMWQDAKDMSWSDWCQKYFVNPIKVAINTVKGYLRSIWEWLKSTWIGQAIMWTLEKLGFSGGSSSPQVGFTGAGASGHWDDDGFTTYDRNGNYEYHSFATVPASAVESGKPQAFNTSNSVTWGTGAIQIYASPGMDEQAIANLVMQKINDRERSQNMRGGRA